MAALSRSRPSVTRSRRRGLWFERIMAIIALINFLLVCFDLSYIRFRDMYLEASPELTTWYGANFKGIEPERSTQSYLKTVDQLEEQVSQTGLQSSPAMRLLQGLRTQSEAMIDENPFQVANKSGTLERIKNLMRDRTNQDSAKDAFNTFWSQDYFDDKSYTQEIAFFNSEIKPLMETNYFRRIDFDGAPLDWFWKIDVWFIGIFGIELLARSFYLRQRYENISWLDALLWRWYDLLMVIPFSAIRIPWLALSRIIPVAIRLDRAGLVDLEPFQNRINRFFISQVAIELTEVVILRVIDQAQNLIRNGDVARWIMATGAGRRYIDINGVNEVQIISQRLTSLLVDQVLPQIKPEIDAFLSHSVSQAMEQAPGYKSFRQIPGIGDLPNQISQQVVSQLSANLYDALRGALSDEKGAALMQAIVTKLGDTLRAEAQQDDTVEELQSLSVALLEEIKINYVKQVAAEDWEVLEEKRYRLYDVTQKSSLGK